MNIQIAKTLIGDGQAPYIIAEVSGNHNGDLNKALRLIEIAKESGANAVKIQTYTPLGH
jgi:N-acetylneuraminate synthase